MEPVFVSLARAMKLKVGFLGLLCYSGTKKTVLSAFINPALSEAVARLIGNGKVLDKEVASDST